jgi:hypothetical protein
MSPTRGRRRHRKRRKQRDLRSGSWHDKGASPNPDKQGWPRKINKKRHPLKKGVHKMQEKKSRKKIGHGQLGKGWSRCGVSNVSSDVGPFLPPQVCSLSLCRHRHFQS